MMNVLEENLDNLPGKRSLNRFQLTDVMGGTGGTVDNLTYYRAQEA